MSAICALLPLLLLGQSKDDTTVNNALSFYALAPKIYADLVLGDSCQVRLKREREGRMLAEKARLAAEMQMVNLKTRVLGLASEVTHWKTKYRIANSERWIWRIVGVSACVIGTVVVLKPP